MARWRLTGKHYLNVPGTEWEREEIDTRSNKPMRKRYPVPLFLNPDDAADHNYPDEIIVANAPSREYPRDIIFTGPPTPDMEPLDDEAEAITDQLRPTWAFPGDFGSYGESIVSDLQRQIIDMQNRIQPPAPLSAAGISKSDFDELKAMVAGLTAQNQALQDELDSLKEGTE